MNQEEAIQKIALRCRYDLFYLAKYILGYDLMEEEVHGDMCKYVEALLPSHPTDYVFPEPIEGDKFDPRRTNLLLLMPRGTFKSSVVTIGFSLQYILNEPNARILIDSETFSKAKAFLTEIKGHLEGNEAFRQVFFAIHGVMPDGSKKKKDLLWTDFQLTIAARSRPMKEPTFSCAGIDVTKTGMHYDLIIMDDLHSEKNVTTANQLEQVIDHWKLSYSLLDPGKPLIVIGTRWHYLDLYNHILKDESGRFNVMVRSAIKPDGSLLFPQRLTEKFLEDVKQTQGTAIFSKQYQNNPVDDESATFKIKDMVRKPWELVKDRPMNWYIMVDPSYTGPYSDFAALVVAGMDFQRDLYVRYILRKKMTYSEIINEMFILYDKFKPKTILIETLATQKSITYELNNEQRRRGKWLPITEIKSRTKSKEERVRALAPFYEFGHIFHISDCPQLEQLELELSQFPFGEHDDIIDALSTILETATPPNPKKGYTETKYDDEKKIYFKPRSSTTGY